MDPLFTRKRCKQRHHARRSLSIALLHSLQMKCARFHCLGYPRHQRPQFEGLFVHAAMSGTFRRRKVRIPEVYLGKENIGLAD